MTDWPLHAGEPLLWEGRPSAQFSLAPVRGTVRQLVLVWGGVGLLMGLLMGVIDPAFIGPTILGTVGLVALIVGAVAWANQARRRTQDYAVTDRRALIRSRSTPGHGRELVPFDADAIEVRPGPKPSVLLGRGPLTFRMEAGGQTTTHQDYVLEMIDEAETVADLLRAAAARNAPDRPDPVGGVPYSARAMTWKT